MNFINGVISLLIASCIFFLVFGIKHFAKKEMNVNRFSIDYSMKKEEAETKPVKVKQQVPLNKAVPIVVVGGIGIAIVTYSIVGIGWVSIITSFISLLFPKLWLDWHIEKQRMEVDMGMELVSETIATVLRSGGNLAEALERAAMDTNYPLNGYLIDTATQIRTGTPQAEAFEKFSQRVALKELSMINVAMNLQQQGMPINLPEMFFEVQKNVRERIAFKGELRVLTSSNKMSAWIVSVLPFGTLAILRQMAPEIVNPMFTTSTGLMTSAVCTGLIGIGIYWVMQMIKPNKD